MNTKNVWQTVQKNQIFEDQWGHKVRFDDVITPAGKQGKYFVMEGMDYVVILALTKDNKVIVEKQRRYPVKEVVIELPVGGVEANEEVMDAAKRELKEETGAESNNWEYLGWHWVDCGYSNLKGHVFLALDVEIGEAISDDENEIIEVEFWDWAELVNSVKSGEIKDLRSKIAVLLGKEYLER